MISKEERFEEFFASIRQRNKSPESYSINEIQLLVTNILEMVEYNKYGDESTIPIVKIVHSFGIKLFKSDLKYDIIGRLYVNGITNERFYGKGNKVIACNLNMPYYNQRVEIVYEFAYFLFEYIGSEEEFNENVLFCNEHTYNVPCKKEKQIVDFQNELLMPEKLFIKEHDRAVDIDNRFIFVKKYLSRFFQVPEKLIIRRNAQLHRKYGT